MVYNGHIPANRDSPVLQVNVFPSKCTKLTVSHACANRKLPDVLDLKYGATSIRREYSSLVGGAGSDLLFFNGVIPFNGDTKSILEEAANRPSKIQLAGSRNITQAMNRAQLKARRLIYQRQSVEDTALSDANIVQIGDRVRWADVYDEVIASGEILSISGMTFTTSE